MASRAPKLVWAGSLDSTMFDVVAPAPPPVHPELVQYKLPVDGVRVVDGCQAEAVTLGNEVITEISNRVGASSCQLWVFLPYAPADLPVDSPHPVPPPRQTCSFPNQGAIVRIDPEWPLAAKADALAARQKYELASAFRPCTKITAVVTEAAVETLSPVRGMVE